MQKVSPTRYTGTMETKTLTVRYRIAGSTKTFKIVCRGIRKSDLQDQAAAHLTLAGNGRNVYIVSTVPAMPIFRENR